jgi:hypothetical protein
MAESAAERNAGIELKVPESGELRQLPDEFAQGDVSACTTTTSSKKRSGNARVICRTNDFMVIIVRL